MITATPPPAPIVKIGVACHAVSINATIKLDGRTYRISTIEICGKRIVLRGKAVR